LDIKSKSFNQNKILKAAVFGLCIIFFLTSLTGMGFIYNKASMSYYGNGIDDLLLYKNYKNSAVFQTEFQDKLNSIVYLLDQYKNEEYIKSGKTITEQRLDDELRGLYYNGDSGAYTYLYSGNTVTVEEAPWQRYGGRDFDEPGLRQQFVQDYADQIAELKQRLIQDDLRAFVSQMKELNQTEGFSYFATDGTYTLQNVNQKAEQTSGAAVLAVTAENFQKEPAYLIYENDDFTKVPSSREGTSSFMTNLDRQMEANLDDHYNPELKVYISFNDSYFMEKEAEFADAKAEILRWFPMTIVCALLSLVLLIYLIVTTGGKDEKGNYVIGKADRIFTEIQLLAIGLLFIVGGIMFLKFLLETVNYGISIGNVIYSSSSPLYLSIFIASVIGLFSAGLGLFFILSVVRNIKAGRFLDNSLIYRVIAAVWNGLKMFYLGGSLMKKVVLITLTICILSATIVLAPVVAVLIIILAPKWVNKFEGIKKGVEEVRKGNLAYKINAEGESELDELARGINQISEASSVAIQNELKNQRMKTDLISNVSHDLKTPLTSIITYIDLLKQEGLDSADAPKYLEILDQKSIRLKKLTEDLFDAAKASSGAIPVKLEKVEMLSLINQGLGEMSDRIEASGLEFKMNARKEKYYVNADGQLLWRVVENLLGNVLKYAQENSRVYIDLYESEGGSGKAPYVVLAIKNISKTELNIDADELMERFKRGDESRTTEGSGLGLAIAKDLVKLQNGFFEIKIDGDLFKAVVLLEEYPGEKEDE